jgi:AcrR family transcriptional regulator
MRPAARGSTVLPTYQPVPAEQRAEQTRRAIADAAIEAFRIHGYAATTMGAVAALAGVSPRTLYRHYGSKSALFAATIAVGTADFLEQLAAYVQRWPLRRSILTAFAQSTVESSEENRAMLYLVTTEDEVSRYWLATSQRMIAPLAATLRASSRNDMARSDPASAGLGRDDPVIWDVRAAALLGAMNCAYRRWANTSGSDLIDLVTDAVDTVLPILSPSAPARSLENLR